MQTARLSHRARCGPQKPEEKAAEMARAHSQALGEDFHPTVPQATLTDQPQSSRNSGLRSCPGRSSRRAFRAATQTGAKTRLSGGGGGRKVTNVLLFRCRCGTDRAAVNSTAEDTNEELAVEACIA